MYGKTLDLSQSYHPCPKPEKKGKKTPQPINRAGKKTTEWKDTREILKEKFEKWGIVECELKLEGCWKNNALGFAHKYKRINLRADELTLVLLACDPCHHVVEYEMPTKQWEELFDKTLVEREFKIAERQ